MKNFLFFKKKKEEKKKSYISGNGVFWPQA